MALYDILSADLELLDRYTDQETGEISEEFFAIKEESENKISEKVDNTGKFIKSLESENDGIDQEIQRLTMRKSRNGKKIEGLKKYIEYVMTKLGYEKLDGLLFTFSYRASKQTQILDQAKLPEELKTYSISLKGLNAKQVDEFKSIDVVPIDEIVNIQKPEVKKWFEALPTEEQEKYADAVKIHDIKTLTMK